MVGLFHSLPSSPGDGLLVPLILHQQSHPAGKDQLRKDSGHLLPALAILVAVQALKSVTSA